MTIRNQRPASTMASCDSHEAMAEEPSVSPLSSDCGAAAAHLPPTHQPMGSEERERVRWEMLERLSTTSAHFAHRQRDAPDLTPQEKVDIAAGVLDKSPAAFLARFGKFLQVPDLAYFQGEEDNSYEVGFYLREIQHRCSHARTIVKNRRYSAMKQLEEGGVYFSEEEMKQREPLLYEQMIGQFLTEEEQSQKAAEGMDRSDLRFSSVILNHMDYARERALYKHQKDMEEGQEEEEEEEEDSEDEEDDNDEEESRPKKGGKIAMEEEEEEEAEDVPEISDVRATSICRQQLREEFRAIMHEKFLSGDDINFDYSKVDENPDYDSLAMEAQDEENKYFLSEDPQAADRDSTNSSDSDRDSAKCAGGPLKMEEGGREEEEEDYMMYEPSAELVSKSARFVRTGTWRDKEEGEEEDA